MEFPQEGHEPDTPGLLFDKHIQKWNFSCLSNIFRKLERFKWNFQEHEEPDTPGERKILQGQQLF